MMLEEFSKLTGFTPDQDYYHAYIEPEYLESDLDKLSWCKQWVKNGGIQKAYDYIKNERYIYKVSYEQVVHGYSSLREDYDKLLKEKNDSLKKIEGLKMSLHAVIEKLSYLFDQCQNEQDNLSALITKLIEVKIS